jgi:hypothetical protein
MPVDPSIRRVFGHFQNLNLLVLVEDLRGARTAHRAWSSGALLCPVAHGLPTGRVVSDLRFLDQAAQLGRACDYAARHLGADPAAVFHFVRRWDEHALSPGWLLQQLEGLWEERLADAEAVQELFEAPVAEGAQEESARQLVEVPEECGSA